MRRSQTRAKLTAVRSQTRAKLTAVRSRSRAKIAEATSAARRFLPAAAYGAFCAALSATPFVFGTYPFGFALLAAAEGREYVAAALAGIVVGSVFVDGGGFVTLAAFVVAAARLFIDGIDRRREMKFSGGIDRRREMKFSGGIAGRGTTASGGIDRRRETPSSGGIDRRRETPSSGGIAGRESPSSGAPDRREAAAPPERPGLLSAAVFREELPVRCALACAGAIVIGGVGLLFHANVWRAAAAIALSAAAAPVFCAAFSGLFRRAPDRTRGALGDLPALRAAWAGSALAVLFCASWLLRGVSVASIRLGAAFALLTSFAAAHFLSAPEAAFVAFAASLPLEFAVVPAVILASFAYSLTRRRFPRLAAAAGGLTAIFFSLGAIGLSAASRYGGAFILASALAAPAARALSALCDVLPPSIGFRLGVILRSPLRRETADVPESAGELRSLSDCFISLGGLADSVSRALAAPESAARLERAFDRRCAACSRREGCDSSAYRAEVARALRRGERAEDVPVPPELSGRCSALGSILRAAGGGGEGTGRFARDLSDLGALLRDVSRELGAKNARDDAAARGLRRALEAAGIYAAAVSVTLPPSRRVRLSGIDPASLPADASAISRIAGRTLGCTMTEPEIAVGGDGLEVTLRRAEALRVTTGRCSLSASNAPCGDSAAAFVSRDGLFYAVISDGMGSGTEAAFTAGTVTLFLERLLSAAAPMPRALGITNSFLRDRGIECSATVDVAEIDLVGGEARFFKSGAAPSHVLRGGRLFRLCSRTVPIGILPDAETESLRFGVRAGDVIVMTSDGVTGDGEDCPWLAEALRGESFDDPTEAARRVADEAKRRTSDDVTVMILRVDPA